MQLENDFFSIETDTDGFATLLWDRRDKSVNVFDEAALTAFEGAIAQLIASEDVKGVVIASAKSVFHVGADLEMAAAMADRETDQLYTDILRLNAMFRSMETAGKPFVAAIAGHALGGGFEMALACHARIVADNPKTQLGLPEAKVGLIPSFGGTQRLARLIPLTEALTAMTQGKSLSPQRALSLSAVTSIVDADVVEAAKDWLRANKNARQPWDQRGFKPPSGPVQSPSNAQLFAAAAAQAKKATYGNYPAVGAILEAVYHGLQLPIDQGIKVEARKFIANAQSPVSRHMIRTLFFGMNAADNLERRPESVEPRPIKKIGIVGAGLMGGGVAYQAAKAGLDVALVDVDAEAAERGKAYSTRLLDKAIERGKLTEDQKAAHLGRITPAADYAALADCDVIIEAVFESKSLKETVLKAIEEVARADALIASNTSTIPITELASFLNDPTRFIGLHFFSPVEKMPLVEIISGKSTSTETLAFAFDVCKALKKTPIDVNDGRAFYTTRVVSAYMVEGMCLLTEGVAPARIENAGRISGMPMGPLRLADMVNLDLVVKIADQTAEDLGDAHIEPAGVGAARKLVAAGRLGEKSAQGFYDHEGPTPHLWPGLNEHYPSSEKQPSTDKIINRLMAIQAIETLRCFDEGVLKTAEDADLGSILGWGFPAFTGGVASYIDQLGAAALLDRAEALSEIAGARFAPPTFLKRLAASGAQLYAA